MVTIPASVGELIDKLTILRVKQTKIISEDKLGYVNKEFELLYDMSKIYLDNSEINSLYHQLIETNSKLWDIEDELRVLEKRKSFNIDFIELARKVYYTNDERFRLKHEINLITLSEIREVKDYKPY